MTTDAEPHVGREESDVNVRAVLGFGAALFGVMVVVLLAVWLLFTYLNRQDTTGSGLDATTEAQESRLPPEPRLQQTPREDLRAFRAGEDALLNRYEWVDRQAGVVRIPIGEAMKLVVQRGLPARQQQERSK